MKPVFKFNLQLLLIQLLLLLNPLIMPLLFNASIGIRYSGITFAALIALGMLFCLEQLYFFFTNQGSLLLSANKNYIISLEIAFQLLTVVNFFQQPLLIAILPIIQLIIVHSYIAGESLASKSHLLFYALQLLLFQCQFLYTVNSLVPSFRVLLISFLALLASVLTVHPFFVPKNHGINKPGTFGLGLLLFILSAVVAFLLLNVRWYILLSFVSLMIFTSVPISFIYYRSNHTLAQPAAKKPSTRRRDASDSYNSRRR